MQCSRPWWNFGTCINDKFFWQRKRDLNCNTSFPCIFEWNFQILKTMEKVVISVVRKTNVAMWQSTVLKEPPQNQDHSSDSFLPNSIYVIKRCSVRTFGNAILTCLQLKRYHSYWQCHVVCFDNMYCNTAIYNGNKYYMFMNNSKALIVGGSVCDCWTRCWQVGPCFFHNSIIDLFSNHTQWYLRCVLRLLNDIATCRFIGWENISYDFVDGVQGTNHFWMIVYFCIFEFFVIVFPLVRNCYTLKLLNSVYVFY